MANSFTKNQEQPKPLVVSHQTLNDYTSQIAKLKAEIDSLNEIKKAKESDISKADSEAKRITDNYKSAALTLKKEMDALKSQTERENREASRLRSEAEAVLKSANDAKAQIEIDRGKLNSVSVSLDLKEKELVSLKNELETQKVIQDTLSLKIKDLNVSINAKLSDQQKAKEKLDVDIQSAQETLRKAKEEATRLETLRVSLEAKEKDLDKKLSAASEKEKSLLAKESDLIELSAKLTIQKTDNENQRKSLESLNTKLVEQKTYNDLKERQLRRVAKVQNAEKELEKLMGEDT